MFSFDFGGKREVTYTLRAHKEVPRRVRTKATLEDLVLVTKKEFPQLRPEAYVYTYQYKDEIYGFNSEEGFEMMLESLANEQRISLGIYVWSEEWNPVSHALFGTEEKKNEELKNMPFRFGPESNLTSPTSPSYSPTPPNMSPLPLVKNKKPKTLRLYSGGCEWTTTYYEGTLMDEMLSNIRKVCNIATEDDLTLQDENGYPIFISSYLPDKTQIFVHVKKKNDVKQSNNVQLRMNVQNTVLPSQTQIRIPFRWDASNKECDAHDIICDGLSVGQSTNRGYGKTTGTITFDESDGRVCWSVSFVPFWCCCMVGISDVQKSAWNNKICSVFDTPIFQEVLGFGNSRPDGNLNLDVICVADMNVKKFYLFREPGFKTKENDAVSEQLKNRERFIYDPEITSPLLVVKEIPARVKPVVGLKHQTFVRITDYGRHLITENRLDFDEERAAKVITYNPQALVW